MSCKNSLYILDMDPLLDMSFANILSHSVGSLFMISLTAQMMFSLISPICLSLLLLPFSREIHGKNIAKTDVKDLTSHVFF